MSHFYGSLRGDRGEVTRRGSPCSGLQAHVRGWNHGIRVQLEHCASGEDVYHIFATGGSNRPNDNVLVATLTDNGIRQILMGDATPNGG